MTPEMGKGHCVAAPLSDLTLTSARTPGQTALLGPSPPHGRPGGLLVPAVHHLTRMGCGPLSPSADLGQQGTVSD